MKKLLTLSVLGLVLGLSTASFAQDTNDVFGVQLPIESREVGNQVHGDYPSWHQNSASNIFGIQLPIKQIESNQTGAPKSDYVLENYNEKYIVVFGVKIPYSVS